MAALINRSVSLDDAYQAVTDWRVPLAGALKGFAVANVDADRFSLFMATRMALAERHAAEQAAMLDRWVDDGGRVSA